MFKFIKFSSTALIAGMIYQTSVNATDIPIESLPTDITNLIILKAIKSGDYNSLKNLKETNTYFNSAIHDLLENDILEYFQKAAEKKEQLLALLKEPSIDGVVNEVRTLYKISHEILRALPLHPVHGAEIATNLMTIGAIVLEISEHPEFFEKYSEDKEDVMKLGYRILMKAHHLGNGDATKILRFRKDHYRKQLASSKDTSEMTDDRLQESLVKELQADALERMKVYKSLLSLLEEIAPGI